MGLFGGSRLKGKLVGLDGSYHDHPVVSPAVADATGLVVLNLYLDGREIGRMVG